MFMSSTLFQCIQTAWIEYLNATERARGLIFSPLWRHFNALQVPRCTDGLMAEVLNQLTAAYESWRDEDGLRTVSLRSLNHVWETQPIYPISRWIKFNQFISPWAFAQVLRYLLGWPSTVLQHVLEARRNDRNTVCNDGTTFFVWPLLPGTSTWEALLSEPARLSGRDAFGIAWAG